MPARGARSRCRCPKSVALSGDRLPARYPETAAALAEVADGREHVAVIDRVLRRVEALPTLEPGALATAERILALAARSLSPRGLDRVGRRLLAQLDPDGVAPDPHDPPGRVLRVHRRRAGGVSFDGVFAGALDAATPIPPGTARRLACDAGVVPVVLGGRGEPLDVGRMRYTIPTGVRRALHNRDRGCAWPGCGRPPRRCHGHHVEHWADGGVTALADLVLLCRHHHDVVHRAGWRIAMRDGRPWFVPPPWIDPQRRARPDRPRRAPDCLRTY